MKPSPMDRRFLDLMDRIETEQSESLSALGERMARIEASLEQLLQAQRPPQGATMSSEELRALLQGIMTLSEQILQSDQVNRVLHKTVVELHDLLAASPEAAEDA